MEAQKEQFSLADHMFVLLMEEPFFASLSRRINKTVNTNISTAGVRIDEKTKQFELIYNPDFFEGLTDKQKRGVLKHEFYHLIFDHLTGRKPSNNPNLLRIWNYATDLAINSHLVDELPDCCVFPGKGDFKKYPPKQSSEWYYDQINLDEKLQEKLMKGSGEGQFDIHDFWDKIESSGGSGIAKERLKNIIRRAAQEANEGGKWGSISADCKEKIFDFIKTKLNWRSVLRYFIKTSQRADKYSTPRRINKRYQYIHPGKNVHRQATIAIAIDQSGSVSNDLLNLFFNELNKLAEIATFTVIPHDCEVCEDKIFVWKKGQKIKAERVLSGGTDFNPPTDYINKHGFDGAIFLTDLEAPKPKACKCQRLWITDEHHAKKPYFHTNERIISIDK